MPMPRHSPSSLSCAAIALPRALLPFRHACLRARLLAASVAYQVNLLDRRGAWRVGSQRRGGCSFARGSGPAARGGRGGVGHGVWGAGGAAAAVPRGGADRRRAKAEVARCAESSLRARHVGPCSVCGTSCSAPLPPVLSRQWRARSRPVEGAVPAKGGELVRIGDGDAGDERR